MNNLHLEHLQQQIKTLEKQNRLLRKELDYSEANRVKLENSYKIQSNFVNQALHRLEKSRIEAEARSQELQESLNHLQLMQTKLVESEKMSALGILVAGIAHEINNPINFIYGNISHAYVYLQNLVDLLHLYQETYPEPGDKITTLSQELDLDFVMKDLFKILDSMQVGSDRIRQIVSGLRTFSHLDQAAYKETDLHEGLDSALMLLQHRLKAHGMRPNISVLKHYEALPKIACFSGQLNQVFMNVLMNAIDAIEAGHAQQLHITDQQKSHWIKIYTSITPLGWARISISDNGSGMTEQVQHQIFNPFFTTKPPGQGTGMGLSISYQIIVENHGGKIDCFSRLGEGTEFVIQIPITQTQGGL